MLSIWISLFSLISDQYWYWDNLNSIYSSFYFASTQQRFCPIWFIVTVSALSIEYHSLSWSCSVRYDHCHSICPALRNNYVGITLDHNHVQSDMIIVTESALCIDYYSWSRSCLVRYDQCHSSSYGPVVWFPYLGYFICTLWTNPGLKWANCTSTYVYSSIFPKVIGEGLPWSGTDWLALVEQRRRIIRSNPGR